MLYSIVQTQKHIPDNNQENFTFETSWIVHPVMWLRVGEPYDALVDAQIERNKFTFPEDFIIVPHY